MPNVHDDKRILVLPFSEAFSVQWLHYLLSQLYYYIKVIFTSIRFAIKGYMNTLRLSVCLYVWPGYLVLYSRYLQKFLTKWDTVQLIGVVWSKKVWCTEKSVRGQSHRGWKIVKKKPKRFQAMIKITQTSSLPEGESDHQKFKKIASRKARNHQKQYGSRKKKKNLLIILTRTLHIKQRKQLFIHVHNRPLLSYSPCSECSVYQCYCSLTHHLSKQAEHSQRLPVLWSCKHGPSLGQLTLV